MFSNIRIGQHENQSCMDIFHELIEKSGRQFRNEDMMMFMIVELVNSTLSLIHIYFEMSEGDKKEIGTTITLYLSEDSLEFANEYRVREVLTKYCSFMPVEIFLSKEGAEQEYETCLLYTSRCV